ncbi:MAG: hypothetical protein JNJ42_08235 [Burkholderiaceae bacterium]|nr:hypothetical protein [Burkholderiaceae bacterium]
MATGLTKQPIPGDAASSAKGSAAQGLTDGSQDLQGAAVGQHDVEHDEVVVPAHGGALIVEAVARHIDHEVRFGQPWRTQSTVRGRTLTTSAFKRDSLIMHKRRLGPRRRAAARRPQGADVTKM